MNWEYISGFFDADGSVTLVSESKGRRKGPQISFHNNELCILEEMRDFIHSELGVLGFISKKVAKKVNHSDAYDLKYTNLPKVLLLISKMSSRHPKKMHRFKVIQELQYCTPRNGKYSSELLKKRELLEDEFFMG